MTTPQSSLRRDVLSAYAASGAKVLSWVIVSAIVFREHPFQYAVLALARGTLSLLNYTTLGLTPALVRMLAEAKAAPLRVLPLSQTLDYATATPPDSLGDEGRAVYVNGLAVATLAGVLGFIVSAIYAMTFERIHETPVQGWGGTSVIWLLGCGIVLRLMSEAPAAVVQTSGSITRDNTLVIVSEIAWVLLALYFSRRMSAFNGALPVAAVSFAMSGGLLLAARLCEAWRHVRLTPGHFQMLQSTWLKRIVAAGLIISIAQLADFLYAPTDYILINRLISPGTVAYYAPAVQIDAGLLLLVSALAAVLLPKAALAHAGGDVATLRLYYIRGTLLSLALLLAAGVVVYFLSPWIFKLWLGDPLPRTQAILPLVLIHTVLGGSAGVGRSILLGMGKVKPFAAAAMIAGVANVLLSYSFVKFFGLGLNGIVYGTILAVIGRCVVWQPWYVLRTLKRERGRAASGVASFEVPTPL